jgi:hypothetical protein
MRYLKIALGTIGLIASLLGIVWVLQGVNVLPGSFMTGDIRWAYRGAVVGIVGAALLWWALRTPGIWRGVLGCFGVFIALQGIIFFLQGINLLQGSSMMSGNIRWAYWGGLLAVIGIGLLLLSRRKREVAVAQ